MQCKEPRSHKLYTGLWEDSSFKGGDYGENSVSAVWQGTAVSRADGVRPLRGQAQQLERGFATGTSQEQRRRG